MASSSTTIILQMISAGRIFIPFGQLLLLITSTLLINNVVVVVDGTIHWSDDPSSLLQYLPVPALLKNESSINVVGFSMEILHETYSRKSPFYNPNATLLDRAIDLFRRSKLRAEYYRTAHTTSKVQDLTSTPMKAVSSSLLAVFDMGTPPVRSFSVMDTGSSLLWVQCRPCNHNRCYSQTPSIYDPAKSSSYARVKCSNHRQCRPDHVVHCSYTNGVDCAYNIHYADDSISAGEIATESFTFGDRTRVPNIVFGCGHENVGTFFKEASGLLGLNTGVNSLLSQLKVNRLSFCFPRIDRQTSGQLRFGSSAIFTEHNMIQMYPKSQYDYLLPLERIHVGRFGFIQLPPGLFVPREDGTGGIVLDTGTTITHLNEEAYTPLLNAVVESIGSRVRRVYEHPTSYELCYQARSWDSMFQAAPGITFYFAGGGVFFWSTYGTFLQVDTHIWCFLVLKSDFPVSILGSFQMQGNVVGLDLATNQVSFTTARTSTCLKV